MHTVIVFLSILLLFFASSAKESQPSDLQLIAKNFRILSGVTNAIHLQSLFIEKSIKFRDLVSELFQIDPKTFDIIMSLDIKTAKSEVHRMHRMHYKTFGENSKGFEGVVLRISKSLNYLKSLNERIGDLMSSQDISHDTLFKAVKTVSGVDVLGNECNKLNSQNLMDFRRLFETNWSIDLFPDDKKIRQILERFKNQEDPLKKCFTSFIDFQISSEVEQVDEAFENYLVVVDSANFLSDFAANIHSIRTVQKWLHNVHLMFEQYKPVWENSKGVKGLGKVMNQLHKSVELLAKHLDESSYSTVPQPHTAGFEEPRDLLKVLKNVKRTWFREKVARNQSVDRLVNALQPFNTTFFHLLGNRTTWSDLTELVEPNSKEMTGAVSKMDNVTRFSENSSSYLKLLKSSVGIIQKCFQGFQGNTDFSKFVDFRRELQPVGNVITRFILLNHNATNFKYDMLYSSVNPKKLENRIEKLINETVKIIRNSKQSDILVTLKQIETALDLHKIRYNTKALDFLERVASLIKEASELKKAANKVTAQKITVKDLLEKVNAQAVDKCLKDSKFDVPTLQFTIQVLDNIAQLSDQETFDIINQYLGLLQTVQDQFFSSEKEFQKVSAKSLSPDSIKIVEALKDSRMFTEQLGVSTKFLENLERARKHRVDLLNVTDFSDDVSNTIRKMNLSDWLNPASMIQNMLQEIDRVNEVAKDVREGELINMTKVFEEAANVHGLSGSRKSLRDVYEGLKKLRNEEEARSYFKKIKHWDLDFAKQKTHLKNTRMVVRSLQKYFDDIFAPKTIQKSTETRVKELSWPIILLVCIGTAILMILMALFAYGLTENGRSKYQNIWLYYFGKPGDFEKRWRYSLFLDYSNGRNNILEAVRDVNKTNLLKALKNGAYINPYNRHGNTALHVATKLAHPEIVKILIRHGADRSLLNAQNQTPEQMIPLKFRNTVPEKGAEFEKIQAIYKKYRKRKFRINVPQKFPESSFRIWIDDEIDASLSNHFVTKYPSISTDDPSGCTHWVVKTDEKGVLHTERLDLLIAIFNGTIIIRESWLGDCLDDRKRIMMDSKYLVDTIEYKGINYNTVLQWSEAVAKRKMPYLYGAQVAVVMTEYDNLLLMSSIVETHGGTMMEKFPLKKYFNKNSHPYLHANLGPIFLIHDGTVNLEIYKNDADKMYELFTEEEFLKFLLKREINRDEKERPIPVVKDKK